MNLYFGSQGEDVRKLQNKLNELGYGLSADGIYGSKTANAVRDYQQKNGLSVDGIAGTNTQGKLYAVSQGTPGQPPQPAKPPEYKPGDTVVQAQQAYKDQLGKKPDAYKSQYDAQIQGLMDQILNRPDFRYDAGEDPMYQQMKDRYVQLGQQAMMDTMGQAANLTGGYGNSYAQGAGQQAYQQYILGLNDKVPELARMAMEQYDREGDKLLKQYGILSDKEAQEYGRYQDDYAKYMAELERLYGQQKDAFDADYGKFRDQIADERWQKQWDEEQRRWQMQWDEDQRRYKEQKEAAAAAASRSRSGGGSGYRGGSGGGSGARPAVPKTDISPTDKVDRFIRVADGQNREGKLGIIKNMESSGRNFTDEEKMYLIQHYGITDADYAEYEKYLKEKGSQKPASSSKRKGGLNSSNRTTSSLR